MTMPPLAHAIQTTGPYAIFVYGGVALCALGAARLAGFLTRIPDRAGGILIVVGVVVAVVGGSLHPEPPNPSTRPDSPGSIAVASPATGATLPEPEVTLQVSVKDFEVLPLSDASQPRPGYGHLHVLRDGLVLDQGGSTETSICVPEGTHTLSAVLVAEDHFGFRNEADLTASVTVEGAPGARC